MRMMDWEPARTSDARTARRAPWSIGAVCQPSMWVIGRRQGLVRSASVCSEEACRRVRQMAPQVTLDERVVAVQTRRSELQVQARAAETRSQCFASRFLCKVPTGPPELVAVSGSVAATLNCSTSWK